MSTDIVQGHTSLLGAISAKLAPDRGLSQSIFMICLARNWLVILRTCTIRYPRYIESSIAIIAVYLVPTRLVFTEMLPREGLLSN